MIEHDPVVAALANRREPFTWNDLRLDRTFPTVGWAALDLVAEEGWTEDSWSLCIKASTRMGIVSLVGSQTVADTATRNLLGLASTCLHNHVRTLVSLEGFAVPLVGLTGREIECVRLVAQEMSDNAIGKALSIPPSTVHEYVPSGG